MMRTSNPALSNAVFSVHDMSGSATMTLGGTVAKTGVLLGIVILVAGFTWHQALQAGMAAGVQATPGTIQIAQLPPAVTMYPVIGAIAGLILAMITIFKPSVSPFTSPLYAAAEGCFLGGMSVMFEYAFPGIVAQAVTLTFGTLATLLTAYATGVIRATEKLKLGVCAATGGIALFYLISMVLSLFHVNVPVINQPTWIGIAFSVFVVVIAALNLVIDFDFIETGVARGAPKYMEWYGAFGILVTLVWLYLEILRLLAKLRSRD